MNHIQTCLFYDKPDSYNSILLVDLDSKIPNISLMKISTYYKNKGFYVELLRCGLSGYPSKNKKIIDANRFTKVFISNIFTVNQNNFSCIGCKDIEIGGVGSINPTKLLPLDIDSCDLDYSLYPNNKTAYGFITKGCNRNCSFCFVPKTEGKLHYYQDIENILKYKFKKISFMDNNILQYKDHKKILSYLVENKIKCEFNQGLDIRCINEENAELLSKLKYIGEYVFAFDNWKYKKMIEKKLIIIKKYILKDWKIKFFIYHNHQTMKIEDTINRINWCKENKFLPYFMRDLNCFNNEYSNNYTDLASYCNQPAFFKKLSFEEFLTKRHNNNIDNVIKHRNIDIKIIETCKYRNIKEFDKMPSLFDN